MYILMLSLRHMVKVYFQISHFLKCEIRRYIAGLCACAVWETRSISTAVIQCVDVSLTLSLFFIAP